MPANNGNAGGTRLVIVESPAKAKTIAGYLGRGYIVESSIGHIRDLPEKADDIPEKYKGEPIPGGPTDPDTANLRMDKASAGEDDSEDEGDEKE